MELSKYIKMALNKKKLQKVLEQGLRTADIYEEGTQLVSCSAMGSAVLAAL